MKKFIALALAALMMLTVFAACSKEPDTLTLDKTTLTLTAEGETAKLTATASAKDAAVTYSSSDDAVATVASDGTVTAVSNGACKITATAGELTATCAVTCSWEASTDLTAFYEDFSSEFGLDGLIALTDDLLENYYPGLNDFDLSQKIAYMPAMTSVVSEYVFVECANSDDAAAVAELLQKRIDDQANGGAWYPESMEAWSKAQVITNGSFVAMIASSDKMDDMVAAFNGLFQ